MIINYNYFILIDFVFNCICLYFRVSRSHVFCDLELEGSGRVILTHRCIVEARAARFYARVCAGKIAQASGKIWRAKLPSGVSDDVIQDFIK